MNAPAWLPVVDGHVVRRLALTDADDWAAFALLPEMQRFTSANAASRADLQAMIERTVADADAPDRPDAPILFTVRNALTRELEATFGFHTVSARNRTAELTYMVRPEQWGRGLATALGEAAVRWAFDERAWVRVQATVLERNVASIRVLQKCGFAFEGRLRNFRIVQGAPRDFMLFSRVPAADAGIAAAPPGSA